MKRSVAREIAVQLCFSYFNNCLPAGELLDNFLNEEYYATLSSEDYLYSEYPDEKQQQYIRNLVTLVAENYIDVDKLIDRYSRNWKSERLAGTSLNILRCAICEIKHMDDIPVSVSINEAVELAKKYDSDEAASFINGILGAIVRESGDNEAESTAE